MMVNLLQKIKKGKREKTQSQLIKSRFKSTKPYFFYKRALKTR